MAGFCNSICPSKVKYENTGCYNCDEFSYTEPKQIVALIKTAIKKVRINALVLAEKLIKERHSFQNQNQQRKSILKFIGDFRMTWIKLIGWQTRKVIQTGRKGKSMAGPKH